VRRGSALLAVFVMFAAVLAAQESEGVQVRGVAWDSLRGQPLAGAFIGIQGSARSTLSDSRGRFRFDSVAPGTHTFTMQHEVLDSIGLSGRSVRAVVDDRGASIAIATPSFESLWQAACGGVAPSRDTAFVHGNVLDGNGRPAGLAKVGVSWSDLNYDKKAGFEQSAWGGRTVADSAGRYTLCGVPAGLALRLVAASDSGTSGIVELTPGALRIARRDFTLAKAGAERVAMVGVVIGTLTSEGGRPVEGAIVSTEGLPEVRSDAEGQFVLRDVPAGTRQLEMRAIGAMPVTKVVDVAVNDTTRVTLEMGRVQTLAEVRVAAPTVRQLMVRQIDERRKLGLAQFRDSAEIARLPIMAAAFDGLRGVKVDRSRRRGTGGTGFSLQSTRPGCERSPMAIWIDRQELDALALSMLATKDIATVEVYAGLSTPPVEFTSPTGRGTTCGTVVVWTKHYLSR